MELGAFTMCLAVKDLGTSKAFYEKLGFQPVGGDESQKWLVLKNGSHKIGLFQGILPKNTLTFNPGWDQNSQELTAFTDVRDLQRQVKANGIALQAEADETTTGPAYFITEDPDGNPIYVDQYV